MNNMQLNTKGKSIKFSEGVILNSAVKWRNDLCYIVMVIDTLSITIDFSNVHELTTFCKKHNFPFTDSRINKNRTCELCKFIGEFIDDGETCPHCKLVQ